MMNDAEDLTGTLVLVNPELKDDPVNKQGQAGMLLYANTEKDDIYVAFGKGEQALYSSDALLVFKQPSDIYRQLISESREMGIPDFKTLMRINMLLEQAGGQNMKEAMQLVKENPTVISRAMVSLQEKLGLEVLQDLAVDKEHAHVRGR